MPTTIGLRSGRWSLECEASSAGGASGWPGEPLLGHAARRPHERGGDRRFVRIESARMPGEKRLRKGFDANSRFKGCVT